MPVLSEMGILRQESTVYPRFPVSDRLTSPAAGAAFSIFPMNGRKVMRRKAARSKRERFPFG